MKKAGPRKTSVNNKRVSSAKKVPTRKYLMEAPSMVGMNYQSGNSNSKNPYGMMSPPSVGAGMSPNMINTGNGGYIQLHNAASMMPNQGNPTNGGFPQAQGGNGNVGFSHPTSPMVYKQMSQPQMGYQNPYQSNQYGGATAQSAMPNVMQSMSTPALMHQQPPQQPYGSGQATTMPQTNSPAPISQQAPPQLPPTDKMVTNCSMPSFADQMNAAYAAYEQQQKLYDQQQNDLLKQLYISHPYPGLNEGGMNGGMTVQTPMQYMAANQQQYQNTVYGKNQQQQRSPYATGGSPSPAAGYPQSGGAGSGSGDSGKSTCQQTVYNAAASTMPKTIPPRNGLGDVTCYQQVSSPFGDPKGYRCFISN